MIQRWRQIDPLAVDVLLAVVCTAVSFGTLAATNSSHGPGLGASGVVLLLGQNVPVAWRRRAPLTAWLVAGLCATAYGVGDYPDPGIVDLGPLIVIYTSAAVLPRRTATIVGVLTAGVIVGALWSAGDADADDVARAFLTYTVAWVLGENQRVRRARAEEDARRAVSAERARIAAELHDVVAHHVSMIVVQAEGGASVVETAPEQATEAFDAISQAGRDALVEMRRILGVLRDEGQERPLAPQPGLDRLGALVDGVRQAGLAVDLKEEGARRPVPPAVDLSAYRIVQEALTNAVRHAGASRVRVTVRYGTDDVELEVVDDGRGPSGASTNGAGHGLAGMRERVAMFGGELHTGAGEGGGFSVVARLPTGAGS